MGARLWLSSRHLPWTSLLAGLTKHLHFFAVSFVVSVAVIFSLSLRNADAQQTQHSPVAATSAVSTKPISGTITAVKAATSGKTNWTLYVVAYQSEARTGMPLAVLRIPNPTFPIDFKMGPEHVMVAGNQFVGPLYLKAKITQRGDVMTRPGDWEGSPAQKTGFQPGATGIKIELSEQKK